jgi:hypothetical protein
VRCFLAGLDAMIRSRQIVGKYRVERKLGEGGFATVYQAMDTIEGVRVALKIPCARYVDAAMLEDLRKEVRIVAQLNHSHILPLKNAEFIDGRFVLAFPLGERSLAERLQHRLSTRLALCFTEQILDAAAYAHQRRIIHCDIKPENMILFPGNQLLVTDFGIARVAQRTIQGSGSGTVGYIAPEQAMGKLSFRSDVFSIGLVSYRMFSGCRPEWPFSWPLPGYKRLRERVHQDVIDLLRRSIQVDPRKRFRDAQHMLSAFRRLKSRAIRPAGKRSPPRTQKSRSDWRTMRYRQFRRRYGKLLDLALECHKCHGPVSEPMRWCPWCQVARDANPDETEFPQYCPRCRRGMKLDWHYCPWCYGPGFEVESGRRYSDVRYVGRCSNSKCQRKELMPFMRYCPWCRRKVTRKWRLDDTGTNCRSCGWGVAKDFWSCCPWCGTAV